MCLLLGHEISEDLDAALLSIWRVEVHVFVSQTCLDFRFLRCGLAKRTGHPILRENQNSGAARARNVKLHSCLTFNNNAFL
jgi:hypothetical protein